MVPWERFVRGGVAATLLVVACGSDGGGRTQTGTGGSAGTSTGGTAGVASGGTGGQTTSGFGGDSSCIGNVAWGKPTKASYTFSVIASDFQTQNFVVGAQVRLCALVDQQCSAPLDTQTTDSTGKVSFTAPTTAHGIAAYLEITGTGLRPTLEFLRFSDPTTLDGGTVTLTVLSEVTYNLFGTLLQITPDKSRGSLTYRANDCVPAALAGISGSLDPADPSTVTGYLAGGVPSKAATATDESGFGGFIDVPSGAVVLTGKSAKSGEVLGKLDLFVRAGHNSQTNLPPTP
jgi:hypothetical protein